MAEGKRERERERDHSNSGFPILTARMGETESLLTQPSEMLASVIK